MALPEPHGKAGWITLAKVRILMVLEVRVAATIRQLEVKICESGPPDRRPQPHILMSAVAEMVKAGQLTTMQPDHIQGDQQETEFYTLPSFYPARATDRMNQLLVHYRMHRAVVKIKPYCANVLEDLVNAAFAAAGYQWVGQLPDDGSGSLDGVWQLKGQRIGMEAKNVREWIYPSSDRVWTMIRKCLAIDAVPLLVTREAAYITRVLFGRMGMFVFEVHRQLFSPQVAGYLGAIRHTDELGYKDVLTWEPGRTNPHLLRFLQQTLPAALAAAVSRWNQNKALLDVFAVQLGGKIDEQTRARRYREFSRVVFPRPQPVEAEEDDAPTEDVGDEYDDQFGGDHW